MDKLKNGEDAEKESYLILFEEAGRKKAIDYAKKYRQEGKNIQLTHKDPDFTLEDYKEHAKHTAMQYILYLKDEDSMEQM